ncbi:hypothetical protein BG004_006149 [Podila humilis]|nr:hypothetical protein BG004_006149 [Podila humilis]
MSAFTRINRARALASFSTHRIVTPRSMRVPIQRYIGRTAAVDRWRPWLAASIATAGVVSWQFAHSLVEAESPAGQDTVMDPDSKVVFPLTIPSQDGSPARLLGLGIRRITFLKVQVYVVGLYAKASDLDDHNSRFRALPEVQKFQRHDDVSADTAFKAMVQTPIELILRIAPVKNTNGPHLRDGFTRNLTEVAKKQNLNEPDLEEAMQGILEFKNLFPKGKINVGQALYFHKSPNGSMTIKLDGEELGTTSNQWLIETFFFGYLQSKNPISPQARDSIAQGIHDLLLL